MVVGQSLRCDESLRCYCWLQSVAVVIQNTKERVSTRQNSIEGGFTLVFIITFLFFKPGFCQSHAINFRTKTRVMFFE